MSDYYFSSCDCSNENQSDFSNSNLSDFSNSNLSDFSNSNLSDFSMSNEDNFSCRDISIEERTQLSIIENSDTICDLLSEIARKKISLNGYSYLNLNNRCSLFNFVVGNSNKQNLREVKTVKCILDNRCIDFIESKTIRVTLPNSKSGTFAKIYCAVSENLDVFSSFFGEDNSLYIETSDNCRAIKIIKSILC